MTPDFSSYRTLAIEEAAPGVLAVRFNRPEVLNAINTEMLHELLRFFGPLAFTPGDLRAIVLTGTGMRAFCAGGDLKERKAMSNDDWRLQHAVIEESAYAVLNAAVPVIAAVNGVAYGGGCELALCCDFIYAADTARFALPEVRLGIMPGGGGTQNLPRAVGERRAKELMLTGTEFSANQALGWGMVNAVFPPDRLMDEALAAATRISEAAPISVRQIKKSIHQGLQTDLTTGLLLEVQAYERVIGTRDRLEGVLAFNEKRPPSFEGR
jgi:enoyl-CoA hydratase/carnithine racemase